MYQEIKEAPVPLKFEALSQQVLLRSRNAHKGDFGHVLVVGGDYGMSGAVRMCAEASLRVGAGLVSVATRPEHISMVYATRPEIMCHGVRNSNDILPLISRSTVIVIGPGLGQSEWSHELFKAVISAEKPLIIDADGLNLLSNCQLQNEHWILTPHPGEASRLLQCTVESVQENRLNAISQIVKQYQGICVLKGAGTLVQSQQENPMICLAGNPGMSSGGMGDVLSGVIAGLQAQHFTPIFSAQYGVLIHAMAGDLAALERGERGLLALDLMPHLQKLMNTYA